MATQQYQGRNVTVRDAREGDPGWVKDTGQKVVKFDDGTEKTVGRDDVTTKY